MKTEVDSRKPQFRKLSLATEELNGLCQEDTEELMADFQDSAKNWNDVNKLLAARQEEVEHMTSKMMEFNTKENYCDETIGDLWKALKSEHVTCVNSEKLRESRDNFNKIKRKIDDMEGSVKTVESLSDELKVKHPTSDMSTVNRRAEEVKDDYEKLKKAAEQEIYALDNSVKELANIENRAGDMADKLQEATKKVHDNRPRKMVAEDLVMQAEDIKASISTFQCQMNGWSH